MVGVLGVLVGGPTGVLVGSLFDEVDTDATQSALADISKSLRAGSTGLPPDVPEECPVAIDAVMASLGATVPRRSAGDVQAEVAAAEDAQREAKKQARTELRDARHNKQGRDRREARQPEGEARSAQEASCLVNSRFGRMGEHHELRETITARGR